VICVARQGATAQESLVLSVLMDGGPGMMRVRACATLVSSCGSLPPR